MKAYKSVSLDEIIDIEKVDPAFYYTYTRSPYFCCQKCAIQVV